MSEFLTYTKSPSLSPVLYLRKNLPLTLAWDGSSIQSMLTLHLYFFNIDTFYLIQSLQGCMGTTLKWETGAQYNCAGHRGNFNKRFFYWRDHDKIPHKKDGRIAKAALHACSRCSIKALDSINLCLIYRFEKKEQVCLYWPKQSAIAAMRIDGEPKENGLSIGWSSDPCPTAELYSASKPVHFSNCRTMPFRRGQLLTKLLLTKVQTHLKTEWGSW